MTTNTTAAAFVQIMGSTVQFNLPGGRLTDRLYGEAMAAGVYDRCLEYWSVGGDTTVVAPYTRLYHAASLFGLTDAQLQQLVTLYRSGTPYRVKLADKQVAEALVSLQRHIDTSRANGKADRAIREMYALMRTQEGVNVS